MWRRIHEMWRYVVRQCENGVQCKMWCGQYGAIWSMVLQWNSLLREVLVWYGEKWRRDVSGMWCGLVFDVEWCTVKCGGNDAMRCEMQWQCVIHSTSNYISGTAHHTTSHIFKTTRSHITWRDVVSVICRCDVKCLECQMWDVALYSS